MCIRDSKQHQHHFIVFRAAHMLLKFSYTCTWLYKLVLPHVLYLEKQESGQPTWILGASHKRGQSCLEKVWQMTPWTMGSCWSVQTMPDFLSFDSGSHLQIVPVNAEISFWPHYMLWTAQWVKCCCQCWGHGPIIYKYKNNYRKLEKEVGMAMPKSIQTRVVGTITGIPTLHT